MKKTVVNKLRHCSLRYVLDLESAINIAIASESGAGTYNPQLSNPKLFLIFGLMTKILVRFAQKSPYNEKTVTEKFEFNAFRAKAKTFPQNEGIWFAIVKKANLITNLVHPKRNQSPMSQSIV